MNQLKKMVRGASIGLIVILIIFMLLPLLLVNERLGYLFTNVSMNTLTSDSVYKDKTFAKGNVFSLLDVVATDDEGYYYLAPLDDDRLTFVYIYKEDNGKAEALSEATWAYLLEEADTITESPIKGRGVLYNADQQLMGYAVEYLEECGYTESILGGDATGHIAPFVYVYVPMKDWFSVREIFFLILSAGIFVFLIWFIITLIAGKPMKEVRLYMSEQNISKEQLDLDVEGGIKGNNYVATGRAIFYVFGTSIKVMKADDVIWAFTQKTVTTHKLYGIIPTGKTNSFGVIMYDRAGKNHMLSMKKEEDCAKLLDIFEKKYPHVILGSTPELQELVQAGGFSKLVEASDARRMGWNPGENDSMNN